MTPNLGLRRRWVVMAMLGITFLTGLGCATNSVVIPTSEYEEMGKLRGNWNMIFLETKGKRAPDAVLKRYKLTMKGRERYLSYEATITNGSQTQKLSVSSFHVDPSHDPKWIDLNISVNQNQWYFARGIYKLEGDRLTICHAAAGDDTRPTRFATTPTADVLVVWQLSTNQVLPF